VYAKEVVFTYVEESVKNTFPAESIARPPASNCPDVGDGAGEAVGSSNSCAGLPVPPRHAAVHSQMPFPPEAPSDEVIQKRSPAESKASASGYTVPAWVTVHSDVLDAVQAGVVAVGVVNAA